MSASSQGSPLSPEQFEAALERGLSAPRVPKTVAGASEIGSEATLMLTIVPGWTSADWSAFGVTLTGPPLAASAVAALEQIGYLISAPAPAATTTDRPSRVYEITSAGRAALLAPALRDPQRARELTRAAAITALRLLEAGRPLLDPLRRWAELAREALGTMTEGGLAEQLEPIKAVLGLRMPAGQEQAEAALDKLRVGQHPTPSELAALEVMQGLLEAASVNGGAVAAALNARVTSNADPADISQWIDAARPLAALLEKASDLHLSLSIDRAGRRLELLHRRRREAGRLGFFVRRDEQLNAIRELVNGPDDRWALHLVGGGGVGKTMLLRYLSVTLADELRASVARVDFDFLTADYPSYAPGELLWNFEEELELRDDTDETKRQFGKANNYLRRLHAELAAGPARTTAEALASPLLKKAIEEYISALQGLPRVILVLDTCEELLRVRPGHSADENIDATFRILAAIHDGPQTLDGRPPSATEGLPSLRVILAGRRPLAGQGFEWQARSTLPPRSFLRLLPLRGFTTAEADAYLRITRGPRPPQPDATAAEAPAPPVPPELVGAILDRAPADVVIPELGLARGDERRYSPYDLAQYADWASDDPPPSETLIRTATPAQYVERRILARLRNPTLELLMPVLAIVKHTDVELLRGLAGPVDDTTFAATIERLRQQEWSSERTVSRGDHPRSIYSVDERVRTRLAAYYRERLDPSLLMAAANYLENQTLTADISELDWSDIDAAIRALDFDQPRAARWWLTLQRRFLDRRGVEWFKKLLDQLFSEGNAAAEVPEDADPVPPSTIRPLLLASLASMTLHTESAAAAATVWVQVAASKRPVADGILAASLELRATLGVIAGARIDAAARSMEYVALWPLLERWGGPADDTVAGAFLAAVEAQVERAETDPIGPKTILTTVSGAVGPVLLAQRIGEPFAHALAGRACALLGRFDEAAEWFKKALETHLRPPSSEGLPDFEFDWVAPSDPEARIGAEAMRALYPGWGNPSAIRALLREERRTASNVDADRWNSAVSQLHLAERPPESTAFEPDPVVKPGRNWRHVHATVPPGFVTGAEVLAARGQIERALDGLQAVLRQPDAFPLDEFVAAQRATLRIAVRMRLAGEMPSSRAGLRTAEDCGLVWMLSTLVSQDSSLNVDADRPNEWLHQRLRASRSVDRALQDEAVAAVMKSGSDISQVEPTTLPLILDLREAELLWQPLESRSPPEWSRSYQYLVWPTTDPDLGFRARLNLRALALFDRGSTLLPPDMESRLSELEAHLGTRRFAEIAFEEGDALALRLPNRAVALLQRSLDLFERCDDPLGGFVTAARLALIAARARDRDRLTTMLAATERAWGALRRRFLYSSSLPEWSELTLYARTLWPVVPSTLPPASSPWRPWTLRVVACLAQASVLQVGGVSAGSLQEWLKAAFGSPPRPSDVAYLVGGDADFAEAAAEAAAEVAAGPAAGWLSTAPPVVTAPGDSATPGPQPSVARPAPSAGTSWTRDLRVSTKHLADRLRSQKKGPHTGDLVTLSAFTRVPWKTLGLSAAGLSALALLVLGVFLSVSRIGAPLLDPMPGNLPGGAQGGAPVVPGAEVAAFRVLDWLPSLREFGFWIVAAAGLLLVGGAIAVLVWVLTRRTYAEASLAERSSTGETERSRAVVTASVSLQILSPAWIRRAPIRATGQCAAGGTRAYGFGAAADLSPELMTALQALTSNGEVELSIPDGLGAPCWEGALRPSRGDADLDIRRISPAFLHSTPAVPPSEPAILVCGAAGLAESMVRESWTDVAKAVGNRVVITGVADASNASVVHMVGTVEETSSGAVIAIAGADPLTKHASSADARLRATDVRARFPNVQLCLLQAVPVRRTAIRRDATRRDANVVRWFAHDVHVRGVPAVIVLPPTEARHGAALAGRIASVLRQRRLDAPALVGAVRLVRQTILDLPGMADQDRWELASDVCVYCTAAWSMDGLKAGKR